MVRSRRKAGEATEAKLLKSAKKIFVEKGFSGASMGQIARLADMNQSLIYHYYPSKEDLWNKVKEDLMLSFFRTGAPMPDLTNPTFDNLIDALFVKRIEFYRDSPEVLRLFKWQALEDAWGTNSAQKKYLLSWVEYVEKLQSDKLIRDDITPKAILALILGAGFSPFFHVPNPLIKNSEELDAYASSLREFFRKTLVIA